MIRFRGAILAADAAFYEENSVTRGAIGWVGYVAVTLPSVAVMLMPSVDIGWPNTCRMRS